MAKGNLYLYFSMLIKQITYGSMLCTIELGLGQDASTDRETILPIADIKGRDGRMVGHLELKVLTKLLLSLSFLYLFCKEDHIFG